MAAADTKKRILDAAQHEFAEHGYHGTSIRNIAQRADVKLGAIRYHHGSKNDLFEAVLGRHAGVVASARAAVGEAQDQAGTPPTIEDVVRLFLEPVLDVRHHTEDGIAFARMMANTVSDPSEQTANVTKKLFDPAAPEMLRRLQQAAPMLEGPELYWSFFLSIGALAMTCRNGDRLVRLSNEQANPEDMDEVVDNLITFAAGGVAALADKAEAKKAEAKKAEGSD
jgi:AcrR family transcriptional regulator